MHSNIPEFTFPFCVCWFTQSEVKKPGMLRPQMKFCIFCYAHNWLQHLTFCSQDDVLYTSRDTIHKAFSGDLSPVVHYCLLPALKLVTEASIPNVNTEYTSMYFSLMSKYQKSLGLQRYIVC